MIFLTTEEKRNSIYGGTTPTPGDAKMGKNYIFYNRKTYHFSISF